MKAISAGVTMSAADVEKASDGTGTMNIALGGQSVVVDMSNVTSEESLTSAINAAANGLGITATQAGTGTAATITFSGNIAGTTATLAVTGADSAAGAMTGVTTTAAAASVLTDNHADDIDITSVTGTSDALKIIDQALLEISDSRADLGAVQNRFGHTISNLANIEENVSASRSRIQDTDFASETATMTKNQILQQAGTSILAQANQIPQAALSLLG
jgi:flagellin